MGTSREQVLDIMGTPARAAFEANLLEWHYCNTGREAHQFVVVYFHSGEVVAMEPYTVTLTRAGGVRGDCPAFVKMGNYSESRFVRDMRFDRDNH